MKAVVKKILLVFILTCPMLLWSQNQSVTIGGTQTDTDAVLWLVGNGQQGLLLPTTSDIGTMPNKAGLLVYNTTDKNIYYNDGNKWTALGGAAGAPQTLTLGGNTLSISNGNSVTIASAAPTQIGQILMWDGTKWSSNSGTSAPLDQQVLRWNNAQARWEPATLASGGTVTNVTANAPLSVTNGTTTPQISLGNSGVTAGIYGTTTIIPELTIDAFGRVTAASARTIPTADGTSAGLLSATDYNRFGNKMNGNILTTSGDVLYHDGTSTTRLPRGTTGQVLTSTASGVQWSTPVAAADAQDLSLSGTTLSLTNDATSVSLGGLAIVNAVSGGLGGTITDNSITGDDLANGAVDLATADITGTLAISKGGTGLTTTPGNNQLLIGNGTGYALSTLTQGTGINISNSGGLLTITSTASDAQDLSLSGSTLSLTNDATSVTLGNLAILNTITTNEIPNGTITASDLNAMGATGGQVLKFNSSTGFWEPGTDNAGAGGVPTLTDGQILIGNGTTNSAIALDGDATLSGGTLTLANSNATRTNLGLAIGTNVQAFDADLDDLADGSLTGTKVGTGISAANITTGTLGVANGGTGATTLSGVVLGNGTAALSGISTSTALQYFRRNAANNGYEFANLAITNGEITDGTITGADLNAAISISTTGNISTTGAGTFSGIGSGLTSLNASNITSGTLALNRLTTGTDTHVLTMVAGVPTWQAPAGGASTLDGLSDATVTSPVAGNILVHNGSGQFVNVAMGNDAQISNTGAVTLANSPTTRTNLGLAIGTNVQAFDADLDDLADGSLTGTKVGTGISAANITTGTLGVANGGTGATTLSGVVLGNGTAALSGISTNTALQYFRRNATNNGYEFANLAITNGEITDGTITGADLNAAISISTTGNISTTGAGTFSGIGSGLTSLNASNITSGALALNRLTTGTDTHVLTMVAGVPTWQAPTSSGWSLAGNAPASGDFIGTTNTEDLVFKTSNFERMRLSGSSGGLGIGTSPAAGVGLHVHGSGTGVLRISTAGIGSGPSDGFGIFVQNDGSTQMMNNENSTLLIGSDNSWAIQVGSNSSLAFGNPLSYGTDGQVLTSQGPGFPAQWENAPAGGGSGWLLTGNSSTLDDGTNFIGTTDGIPLNFRVNNQKSGRIDHLNFNTFFGYQSGRDNSSGTNNTSLGYYALRLNTTATHNTAVGSSALESNTIGISNTSVGYNSLNNNTASSQNTAMGRGALYTMSYSPGSAYNGNNTAIGFESLYNNQPTSTSTGVRNTAIGYRAGYNNTTGSDNVSIGYGAGPSSGALNNTIAIGYNASVTTSNSMVLGGTGVDAVKVGIGTTTPTVVLDVQGTDAVNMPDGTTGQRPTTPQAGAMRYNTTEAVMEYYNGTNWYFVVPKVAFVKDVKSSGSDGGIAVGATWTKRDLNTLEGDNSFVSLSTSQITLSAGEYILEGGSIVMYEGIKIRLRNVSDGVDTSIGSNAFTQGAAGYTTVQSNIMTKFTINTSKIFEIQYYNTATNGVSIGLGNNFGDGTSEVYTQIKITKLR